MNDHIKKLLKFIKTYKFVNALEDSYIELGDLIPEIDDYKNIRYFDTYIDLLHMAEKHIDISLLTEKKLKLYDKLLNDLFQKIKYLDCPQLWSGLEHASEALDIAYDAGVDVITKLLSSRSKESFIYPIGMAYIEIRESSYWGNCIKEALDAERFESDRYVYRDGDLKVIFPKNIGYNAISYELSKTAYETVWKVLSKELPYFKGKVVSWID